MTDDRSSPDFNELVDLLASMQRHVLAVEAYARDASRDAAAAREEISKLRDQLVAAERDQQDLRTARARLSRLMSRGLLGRLLDRGGRS